MRSLILFFLLSISSFSAIAQQCCYGTEGSVGSGYYTDQTLRGTLYAGTGWKSVTVTSNGKHLWYVYDTLYATGDTRNVFFEFYTCSSQDLQLNFANVSTSAVDKRNSNNHNCDSNAYDEHWTYPVQQNQRMYVWVLGDSSNSTNGTFTLYYRVRCRTNSVPSSYALNSWRGHVYDKVYNNIYNTLNYMGSYADEARNFTKDFGTAQPPVNNNCAMCPDSTRIDQDTFDLYYKMHYYTGRGYYVARCTTLNNLTVNYHGGLGAGYDILRYNTNGSSYPEKTGVFWVDSTDANFGDWMYHTWKDTGSLKADITVVKIDGDLSFTNNAWSAYIYDSLNTNYPQTGSNNIYTYRGRFIDTAKIFGYNFNSTPPTATGETGGLTMDNNYYHVWMKGRLNFQQGRYKFRIRNAAGGNLGFYNQNWVTTSTIINTSLGANTDVTSAFYGVNGDTNLQYKFYKYATNYPVSFNYCREPKNPGGIRVNGHALIAGNDTVCIGAPVTLTADTADGTETHWYIKSCLSSTGYIGSGASITVTPDSNTTYYVINRNLSIVATDTANKLDIYSPACASKRLIRVTTPGAPTAPASQTACSDTAYTFTFDSVLAGSGGDQIEWSKRSSFDTSFIVSSGSNINVTVNAGVGDTIYFRSRISATGCVSSAVNATLTSNANPSAPNAPAPQTVCSDTGVVFVFDSLAGAGANQLVWGIYPGFTYADTLSADSLWQVSINVGSADTFWLQSRVNTTGCVSGFTYTTIMVNLKPEPPTPPVPVTVSSDTTYTFKFVNLRPGYGGNQLEWTLDSSFTTSWFMTCYDTTIAGTDTSDCAISLAVDTQSSSLLWLRSIDTTTGCISNASSSIAIVTYVYQPEPITVDSIINVCVGTSATIKLPVSFHTHRYDLFTDTGKVYSAFGSDTTLYLTTGNVYTNTFFTLLNTDTASGDTTQPLSFLVTTIGAVDTNVYIEGDTLVYISDTALYTAGANNSIKAIYSIVSGNASVEALTGKVYGISDTAFILRATMYGPAGCGSTYADKPVKVTAIAAPVAPAPVKVYLDSATQVKTLVFNEINAGSGGNQIEWATNSAFIGSTKVNTATHPATITLTLSGATDTTLWLRTRNSSTGKTSKAAKTEIETLLPTLSAGLLDKSKWRLDETNSDEFNYAENSGQSMIYPENPQISTQVNAKWDLVFGSPTLKDNYCSRAAHTKPGIDARDIYLYDYADWQELDYIDNNALPCNTNISPLHGEAHEVGFSDDGICHIVATRLPDPGVTFDWGGYSKTYLYKSGILSSKFNYPVVNSLWEVRCKMPDPSFSSAGPAVWNFFGITDFCVFDGAGSYPDGSHHGTTQPVGDKELDLNCDGNKEDQGSCNINIVKQTPCNFWDDFHTYSMVSTGTEIFLFIDGKQTWSTTYADVDHARNEDAAISSCDSRLIAHRWPNAVYSGSTWEAPFYICLQVYDWNVPWAPTPTWTSCDFQVDYFRYYTPKNSINVSNPGAQILQNIAPSGEARTLETLNNNNAIDLPPTHYANNNKPLYIANTINNLTHDILNNTKIAHSNEPGLKKMYYVGTDHKLYNAYLSGPH